jgi:ATP-dependent helicase/nuclease subunit A
VDDVQGEAGVKPRAANAQQQAAIEAAGTVFVSAGAGTGKTSVIVERFARAVCERGLDVESILVITYTERAAAELRSRIRARLVAAGRPELALELDGAWISTIHGFCHRLLKGNALAAKLDPRFRVLEESHAAVLRTEAFERALEDFSGGGDDRVRLLATYGVAGLRRMLTSLYETLRAAGRPLVLELGDRPGLERRLEELTEAARCLAGEAAASEVQRAQAARTLDLLDRRRDAELLLDLGDLRARGERAAAYEEARRAVEQAALDDVAMRDRELLQELLKGFAVEYAEAKRRESALDFEDLQLRARDLLRDDPEVRAREAWRFRVVMVDEFQDTNRLQCELVDLIAREDGDRFFVGDEFQSIYGFRHADVGVFRERRAQVDEPLALTWNYRSRPEVLAAVNELFGDEFGDEFQPLTASAEFPDPVFGPPVELLVTDKSTYAGDEVKVHWRRGEARHVARRVRELVDAGHATPGDIVLLFAAGTDAEWYEEELRALDLPTYRAAGRGYFGQQQVADLLAYLRLLRNRYDDEALVSVLASPFVGVSNDALVLIRRAAPRRPLFTALERGIPEALDADDARLCRAFLQRYHRLVERAPSLSLEHLCEEVLVRHDYDLAVLAQWDGRRRYANLRKLARLARSYGELRGPDLEGFVRFVRDQEDAGAKELEAAAEEDGADAVRLLTIHAAKGLEFKVVVVADAGRDRAPPPADLLALPDGRFGIQVADPLTGKRRGAFAWSEIKGAEEAAAEAERRRLYYVAMTRAIDRLVVAGSVDGSKPADPRTPIGWVLERLAAPQIATVEADVLELERGDARFLLRVDRHAETPGEAAPSGEERLGDEPLVEEQLVLFAGDGPPAMRQEPALAQLAPVPPMEPPLRIRRLSYSALALFERCSYRYYAERVAGMRPADASGRLPGETGLAATEIGDAVHRLLELVDPAAPAVPDLAPVRAWYPGVTAGELERIGSLVGAYCGSSLARRIAALDGVEPERPFTIEHDGVLVHGRFDVLHLDRDAGRALVVDYKTNVVGDADPNDLVDGEYLLQRLVYALVCFRAGAEVVEVTYQFLERPEELVTTVFDRSDVAALEARLSEAIDRIHGHDFRPTPSEFVCAGCPALDVVCAGPRLRSATPAGAFAATG